MLTYFFQTLQETIIKASVVSKELGAAITNILVADEDEVDDGVIVVEDRFMDGNGNEGIDFGEHKSFLWYHLFQLLVVIMLASLFLVAVFRLNGMMSPMSALCGAIVGYLWNDIAKLFYGTMLFFSSTEDAKSSRMSRKSFGPFKLFVMSGCVCSSGHNEMKRSAKLLKRKSKGRFLLLLKPPNLVMLVLSLVVLIGGGGEVRTVAEVLQVSNSLLLLIS